MINGYEKHNNDNDNKDGGNNNDDGNNNDGDDGIVIIIMVIIIMMIITIITMVVIKMMMIELRSNDNVGLLDGATNTNEYVNQSKYTIIVKVWDLTIRMYHENLGCNHEPLLSELRISSLPS